MRLVCRVGIVAVMVASMSCSVAFQDSVRSSGTQCSTSRFWWISDAAVAGGLAYVVAHEDGEAAGYIPSALLVGSALIGIYKRGNCVRHQERATPEQWARDSARERDQKRFEAMLDMSARMKQQPPPPPGPGPQPTPVVRQTTEGDTRSTPPPAVTWTRKDASTEVGKTCRTPQPDADLPHVGTCEGGTLCYAGRCTVRCKVDDDCPSGLRCGWTDGKTKMQICR